MGTVWDNCGNWEEEVSDGTEVGQQKVRVRKPWRLD